MILVPVFIFRSYSRARLLWQSALGQVQGQIKDQTQPYEDKIILSSPALGAVPSSLSRDFMWRTLISRLINTAH